jgi:hypothetical protein
LRPAVTDFFVEEYLEKFLISGVRFGDVVEVDSLKALDPNRPIREADIGEVI